MTERLSVAEVRHIAFTLARSHLTYDEPIPDFDTRRPNILEGCLAIPFQKINKKPAYQGLIQKAAVLFYLMIKNHPFQNGNKRIAMTTLFVFLSENGKWLKVENEKLYKFAVRVAESNSKRKTQTINSIESFLENHLVDFES